MTAQTRAAEAVGQAQGRFMAASNRLPVLWHLAEDFNQLLWLLEEPEQDVEAIEAEMRRVASDIRTKGHGVAAVIQALEQMAEFQKDQAGQLRERAKANEAHADRLRDYARACMNSLSLKRLDTGTYALSVRLNNPRVDVLDEGAIPEEFWRQPVPPPEIDKTKILERWRATGGKSVPDGIVAGENTPGTVVVRGERLDIS